MEITTIRIKKITAADGMTLTNGEAFGKEIYLGSKDNPENWQEITDEEAEKLIAENSTANKERKW